MNKEDMYNEIRKILSGISGCFLGFDQIQQKHDLREDLGLDSFSMVTLMVAIEDRFEILLDPIHMNLDEAFQTVDSLVEFLETITSRGGQ